MDRKLVKELLEQDGAKLVALRTEQDPVSFDSFVGQHYIRLRLDKDTTLIVHEDTIVSIAE
jgi:hypothetical protein